MAKKMRLVRKKKRVKGGGKNKPGGYDMSYRDSGDRLESKTQKNSRFNKRPVQRR